MERSMKQKFSLAAVVLLLLMAVPLQGASPFAIRGFKGLWWDGLENYRKAVPWAAEHGMNFVMLCYSSFPASGKDWRADYTAEEMAGFKELAAEADRLGVELCLSFNPGIWSKPPLTYSDEHDYQLAWRKVQAVHDRAGIRSFAICLDDIKTHLQPADAERFKDLAHCQMYFVNRLWSDLHKLDPQARLIFCPSAYTTRTAEKNADYTRVVGDELDPGVQIFWTGPVVCSPSITAADADHMAALYHRKPIVWDNYPVNDMFPWRPLLSPVKNRSADLAGHVAGFMANPMKQWTASTIPLATLADYFRDPAGYDPAASIAHAVEAGFTPEQRPTVRLLLDVYGTRFIGEPGYPPTPAAPDQLAQARKLRDALSSDATLADLWRDVQPTLDADIAKLAGAAK
jgi:hyaluronoglucosaminidase